MHRKAERRIAHCLVDRHVFEKLQQRRAGIPVDRLARRDDVVALQRRHGNGGNLERRFLAATKPSRKFLIVRHDLVEALLVVANEVHLVDRQHDAPDTKQRNDEGVAAGLRQHTLARIDQDDRQLGGGGSRRHVAGILLVARRVGDDEFALLGGEETVGDIDGDALLALRRQPIDQ